MKQILINKSYLSYDRISRYSNFPYYYHTTDKRYIYGTTAQLNDNINYSLYKSKLNDTYDSIALKFYNNPTYFWVICDINKIQDPFSEIEPNTELKIPTLNSINFNLKV